MEKRFLGVSPAQLKKVIAILAHEFNGLQLSGLVVSVFGSRVKGGFRADSDLDLWIESTQPLGFALISKLTAAFEESALPFKVDILSSHQVPAQIAKAVRAMGPAEKQEILVFNFDA